MPRGEKTRYTAKQQRQAKSIEGGYEKRGVSQREASRRAWATVNKTSGGGRKSGSGRGRAEDRSPARKGGRKGAAALTGAKRSQAGKKAVRTRKRHAARA